MNLMLAVMLWTISVLIGIYPLPMCVSRVYANFTPNTFSPFALLSIVCVVGMVLFAILGTSFVRDFLRQRA